MKTNRFYEYTLMITNPTKPSVWRKPSAVETYIR